MLHCFHSSPRSMRLSPLLLGTLSLTVVATACMPHSGGNQNSSSSSSVSSLPAPDEKQTAAKTLDALMKKDMTEFAKYVHPKKGVRFTPETHVRLTKDEAGGPADGVVFADQMQQVYDDPKLRTWGVSDGSGEPITLTFKQYLTKYVVTHDFRTAKDVRWNHVMDRGSTIDNAASVYPNSQIIEYHFPGFDPQYGGMDWESLRLVFEKYAPDGHWYLVGVIHDHWTP